MLAGDPYIRPAIRLSVHNSIQLATPAALWQVGRPDVQQAVGLTGLVLLFVLALYFQVGRYMQGN